MTLRSLLATCEDLPSTNGIKSTHHHTAWVLRSVPGHQNRAHEWTAPCHPAHHEASPCSARTLESQNEDAPAYPAKRFVALPATAVIRGKQTPGEERANEMPRCSRGTRSGRSGDSGRAVWKKGFEIPGTLGSSFILSKTAGFSSGPSRPPPHCIWKSIIQPRTETKRMLPTELTRSKHLSFGKMKSLDVFRSCH